MQSTPVESSVLLDVGVELGYITRAQVDAVLDRQKQLRRGGIDFLVGQTLLERRFLTPTQLKQLVHEVDYRLQNKIKRDAQKPVEVPKAFGQYELLGLLSDHGRSRIYKARDKTLDRIVALKILPRTMMSDPQWTERFKREMQLASKLQHPNIVGVYGGGDVDGMPFMALEYIEGMSLGGKLEREGNFAEKTAWQIAREIAKGLSYAARKDIIHRDIKPENILCSADGKIKIIDMGCSKSLTESSSLTAEGTTVGTPFYISPEQAKGARDLDRRTDIYSLGCTVYHMLTGSVPFLGEQITEVMLKHTQAPRPDPRGILSEISEGSTLLIARMMAINPFDRPNNADILIGDIDLLLPLLPEPEALVRPVSRISPSEIDSSNSDAASLPAQKVQSNGGFFGWLKRLFGG